MELSIQERLKDLRVERGLTLEQLAEETHLSKSALGSYEGDDLKDISHHALIHLAKVYEVTVDLIAQNAVDALTDTQKAELDKSSLSGIVKRVAIGAGIAVIVLLLIFCITRFIGYRSYQRRKQLRRQRPRRRRNYRR